MNCFEVNGRNYYFSHLANFKKVGAGRYSVEYINTGQVFTIEGGKALGGACYDWFVETAEWNKPIYCSSVVDALNMLEKM